MVIFHSYVSLPEGISDEWIDDHGLMTLIDHPPKDSWLLGGELPTDR